MDAWPTLGDMINAGTRLVTFIGAYLLRAVIIEELND
jgi:hypothetical protein